jgi:hypothetical protein
LFPENAANSVEALIFVRQAATVMSTVPASTWQRVTSVYAIGASQATEHTVKMLTNAKPLAVTMGTIVIATPSV